MKVGRIVLAAAFLSILIVDSSARAERRAGALRTGMSRGEVLDEWGVASDKTERETARRETWRYSFGSVDFLEGTVSSWQNARYESGQRVEQEVSDAIPSLVPPAVTVRGKGAKAASPEAQAVLRDILKDVPSSESGDSNGPTSPMNMIPPPQPMMNPISPMPMGEPQ